MLRLFPNFILWRAARYERDHRNVRRPFAEMLLDDLVGPDSFTIPHHEPREPASRKRAKVETAPTR